MFEMNEFDKSQLMMIQRVKHFILGLPESVERDAMHEVFVNLLRDDKNAMLLTLAYTQGYNEGIRMTMESVKDSIREIKEERKEEDGD